MKITGRVCIPTDVTPLTFESPAKLNLFLAVTGRRADGFHDLVSVVAPLRWGDTLQAELAEEFSVTSNDPAVPTDGSNLVLKAATVFRRVTGYTHAVKFTLEKRIPMGAGLGGGSSNAATALRALNQLAGNPLSPEQLSALAAEVGSDCPLFLNEGPMVIRGRGELIQRLPDSAAKRISGRQVLVFKPGFGISTPWAYRQLADKAPTSYVSPLEAENRLATWLEGESPADSLLFNSMEAPAFAKYPALPVLLDRLRREFGLAVGMSGSGSACFALLKDNSPVEPVTTLIRRSWGESALVLQSRLQ